MLTALRGFRLAGPRMIYFGKIYFPASPTAFDRAGLRTCAATESDHSPPLDGQRRGATMMATMVWRAQPTLIHGNEVDICWTDEPITSGLEARTPAKTLRSAIGARSARNPVWQKQNG
jgi:hypothetical protein